MLCAFNLLQSWILHPKKFHIRYCKFPHSVFSPRLGFTSCVHLDSVLHEISNHFYFPEGVQRWFINLNWITWFNYFITMNGFGIEARWFLFGFHVNFDAVDIASYRSNWVLVFGQVDRMGRERQVSRSPPPRRRYSPSPSPVRYGRRSRRDRSRSPYSHSRWYPFTYTCLCIWFLLVNRLYDFIYTY